MSFNAEKLLELLPAIYRIRDQENGGPLRELLEVVAGQIAVLEEDLAQAYDDNFIETCADWLVPYIGDLVAARGVYSLTSHAISQRAQVADTLGYRRRKGTVVVLEQLARDVTGWDAHAVEFFLLLATTQYMNHLRPRNLAFPDLRQWEPLEYVNGPFDSIARTADVRSIAKGRGKYNIPNVGIFLCRLQAFPLRLSPAFKVDDRRYLFSPLGNNTPLFTSPEPLNRFTQLSQPANMPLPIRRRILEAHLENYYGPTKSFSLQIGGQDIDPGMVTVCNLSDKDVLGAEWAHMSKTKYAVDPVLGRLVLPENPDPKQTVCVSFHYGFSAEMGGGEYDRLPTFTAGLSPVVKVPAQRDKLQKALDDLTAGGVVEIGDSGRYSETPAIHAPAGKHIEVRASDARRPTLVLGGDLLISGDNGSEVTLNGLLIAGGKILVSGNLQTLRLIHCTVVPGNALGRNNEPQNPGAASLVNTAPDLTLEIEHSILGGVRSVETGKQTRITNSIVDAGSQDNVAYAAPDGSSGGAPLHLENCTVIGNVFATVLDLASNTIFASGQIAIDRRQQGCVRFCYVPQAAKIPRRYECQPRDETQRPVVRPLFTTLRYGAPGYCQLSRLCSENIRMGADDGAEMGAFHDLFQPQRESNLRVRLDEYLRFGLQAGNFFAT